MEYDAIIIGKGPAGISASLYLARAGYRVLVVGKDGGALERAEKIENYYGFPEPLTGAELVDRGIGQATRLGVTVVSDEVTGIGLEDSLQVKTPQGEYRAKTVLLATGKSRISLKVPGFEEFRGRGISFCAICDGFFYRGKRLGVIGTGDYAAAEFNELLHFTKDLTLFTNGVPLSSTSFPANMAVVTERILSFTGEGKLEAIVTDGIEGGNVYSVDGIFVAIGTAGAADFAAKIGIEVKGTDIVVDGKRMTNVPGVFAAGDCIGGYLQVAKAVADGALAAKGMVAFLKKK